MIRFALVVAIAAGCAAGEDSQTRVMEVAGATVSVTRARVAGDLYHYELVAPLGDAPNAALRLHRMVREAAPWIPRATAGGAMLLHGDFATFATNFAPGLALYLAARDLDVWGVDRRWTLPAADADVSDFGAMGVAQELDDLRAALAIARALRAGERLALVGFSHGAQLAYAYAAVEGGRPAAQRHVDALVPIDFYGAFAPEDEALRAAACASSAAAYELVASGAIDEPNAFLIDVGRFALAAPGAPSDIFPGETNRGALLITAGLTHLFAPLAPSYHLAAPILDGDVPIALRESPEAAIGAWFAGATPHQATRERADFDALLCGERPPVAAPLAQIHVPLLYLGAAGGVGANGVHATTRVSSADVTALVVQRFGPERRAEDFGHADLLFATDAPALAWQPLATWLLHH